MCAFSMFGVISPVFSVEATSPCDLLLGAVSDRSVAWRMRISDYWGNFEGAKYADAWKMLVEDEIDKIKTLC